MTDSEVLPETHLELQPPAEQRCLCSKGKDSRVMEEEGKKANLISAQVAGD